MSSSSAVAPGEEKEKETKQKETTTVKEEEEVPQVIYVDRHMKRCKANNPDGARRATYNPQYELYVIDH